MVKARTINILTIEVNIKTEFQKSMKIKQFFFIFQEVFCPFISDIDLELMLVILVPNLINLSHITKLSSSGSNLNHRFKVKD